MVDVSGVFPKVMIASTGIPPLINITNFADDSNPIDVDQIEVTGHGINVNGVLVTWEKPTAYIVSVSVLAGTEEATSLTTLLESSHARAGANFALAPTVTLTKKIGKRNMLGIITSDDGETYTNGRIVSGPAGTSIDSEGRKQSQTFTFVFENKIPLA